VTYTKEVAWSTQKETYWYLSFDAEPLVVKGLPGVPDSRPSELTPSPRIV